MSRKAIVRTLIVVARVLVFGDEAGDFNFSRKPGSSRYFIVTTVTLRDDAVCQALFDLRRSMMWEGNLTRSHFHAHADTYATRERVFNLLAGHQFRVDSIVLDKAAASPDMQRDNLRVWKTAWFYLLRYVAPRVAPSVLDELVVVAASLNTKVRGAEQREALADVVGQTVVNPASRAEIWKAAEDPGLQIADYCCWAIQRKWERGDAHASEFISSQIASEFRLR